AQFKKTMVDGIYFDAQELADLARPQATIQSIAQYLKLSKDDRADVRADTHTDTASTSRYPNLQRLTDGLMLYPQLVKQIENMLTPYGKLKDNASPELARIRRELAGTVGSISRTLESILRGAQAEGLVEKSVTATIRDGRLVIPIPPAMKRKIRGIVHDESASGKTLYIEPAEVVEANNRIRELESEERREIIRILTEVSARLRPCIPDMLFSYDFLAQIDFTRAKARLADSTGGVIPSFEEKPAMDWGAAVHPLLQLSLAKHGKKVVPLDIELNSERRILILSGPNAGGKSVCLKTVGLLQYMLQCGLPVPMNEGSHTGIFTSLFIDIGDEQSIEDDLSTYSSHLTNLKIMMKQSDAGSLILIDEFGSGTEPQIGGAIAQAVLERFNQRKAYGVITTHYQNLKQYAEGQEGLVNGAMLYDRHLMRPLFQLQIGNPGSSFAIEIARKIGLPEEGFADASSIVGSDYIHADKYLLDIVRDKRYWENKRRQIHQHEKQLEETLARYQAEMEALQNSRKEILRQAKEEAGALVQEANTRIEHTIRTIKEAQAERERTKQARQELAGFRDTIESTTDKEKAQEEEERKIARKMERLQERQRRKRDKKAGGEGGTTAPESPKPPSPQPLTAGDTVKIKGQTAVGEVLETSGKTAVVAFGNLKTTVPLERLERTAQAATSTVSRQKSAVGSRTQEDLYQKRLQFKQDIDVRGMRGDEALQAITYFMDDALLVGASRVRILHGTGTGILRTLIRQYLATVPGVRHFADEHVQFGGAGITVVDLED
ncbi:MAG: Smr/MutS family protein, partial [Prevotellaceae bacterium]|nr:Smr/MutS family protein [Prevotellaceae bacterium]